MITGTNGLEAVQLTRTEHPDLLILEVMMPEMDGLTACNDFPPNTDYCYRSKRFGNLRLQNKQFRYKQICTASGNCKGTGN